VKRPRGLLVATNTKFDLPIPLGAWQYGMAGTFLCTVKAWVDAGLVWVDDCERLGITPDGQIALEGLLGAVERNLLVPASCRRPRSYFHFIFGRGGGARSSPGAWRASWVARVQFAGLRPPSGEFQNSFLEIGSRPHPVNFIGHFPRVFIKVRGGL